MPPKSRVKRKKHTNNVALFRKIIEDDYPDTFQVLCMNCNWGRAMNGGICPHKETK